MMSRSLWPGFDPPTTRPPAPSESTEGKQCTLFVLCSQYVLSGNLIPATLLVRTRPAASGKECLSSRRGMPTLSRGLSATEFIWEATMIGKRVQLHEETWQQLRLLGSESMKSFQELADEAFNDLLRKHGRPGSLKEALRRSAGESATIIPIKRKPRPTRTKR